MLERRHPHLNPVHLDVRIPFIGLNLNGQFALHLTELTGNAEDAGTLAYLEDTAAQARLKTTLLDIEQIGLRNDGQFVDPDERPIALAFTLYPWEWMFHDAFGKNLSSAPTQWIEPPWKAMLSNKGILPLLWEMFPNHPNLLPAYFEDDPQAAQLARSEAGLHGEPVEHGTLGSRQAVCIRCVVRGLDQRPGCGSLGWGGS